MEVIAQEFKFKAQARVKRPNAKSSIKCNIISNKYSHKIYLGFELGLFLRMLNLTSHGVGNVKICLNLGFEVGLFLSMLNLASLVVSNFKYV